jgi:trigger factor
MAEQQRKSEPVERPAEKGDIIIADTVGRIGGEEITGSRGEGREIELGAEGLLPGFSDQLLGVKPGDKRDVTVTFPADSGNPDLAGKEAVFEVTVKEVRQRLPAVIDDSLAEAIGLENLNELRQEIRQRMQRDYEGLSRQKLKRALLDKLAERYHFPVPPGMLDIEFDSIWSQYQAGRQQQAGSAAGAGEGDDSAKAADEPLDAAALVAPEETALEGASDSEPATTAAEQEDEEEAREEYRKLAERRVRLGLLLAEVGRSNNITVSQEELNQALTREARRHPGYERQVIEYYRKNPDAVNNLRAPIFEEKVVDFIVEMAKPEERKVSPEELIAAVGADGEDAAEDAEGASD